MTSQLVAIPHMGEFPDVFVDLVQEFRGMKIFPAKGTLTQQAAAFEQWLDKHELRSNIVIIGRGTGGFIGQIVAKRQPQRIQHILAVYYPDEALELPEAIFPEKSLIPTDIPVTRIDDEAALAHELLQYL
ncbi:hypothetical protein [Corynebacterium sp. HS2168-gen11]|uniref:hypothetical protein n=1 Tax=Corynebacterium sp. HS2168-gen11 TaxID=2974027 RepID=UPI00216B6463|nr:hypothetical protein [Corynebacterium sp. HS2168-gen11]MCS4536133.1 hypothetical protein [Corynebacterium sp. HS2168-gen11]